MSLTIVKYEPLTFSPQIKVMLMIELVRVRNWGPTPSWKSGSLQTKEYRSHKEKPPETYPELERKRKLPEVN